jgi:hypothetical protein
MANFRRRRPRANTLSHTGRRSYKTNPMSTWPSWWDLVFHTRPRRREQQRLLRDIKMGWRDPDGVAWPLGADKPHNYFW